jgi:hypothetical protein
VLAICNDRPGVLATLEELADAADPLSQVRLARMRGRPVPTRAQLHDDPRWRVCRAAIDQCRATPVLRLDA